MPYQPVISQVLLYSWSRWTAIVTHHTPPRHLPICSDRRNTTWEVRLCARDLRVHQIQSLPPPSLMVTAYWCGLFRKEGNVLFNDALNTLYLRYYGVRHMVKDHSDSERGNPLLPHWLLFTIISKVILYDKVIHTTAFVTPVVEHWLEREIVQWSTMKDRSDDPS